MEAKISRKIRAPRGEQISCKGWIQEAAMRMLMNNLDPNVAEKPDECIGCRACEAQCPAQAIVVED